MFGITKAHPEGEPKTIAEAKKRLRQSSKPLLNELELRFFTAFLSPAVCDNTVLCQALRLELARGIWYKPDFFVPDAAGGPIAYECKGPKVFRGGFENLKVCARVHRWLRIILVWEDEAGRWQRQEILP